MTRWAACEIAVALSKYAGEPDAITLFIDFADGYAVHGRLTSDEIHAVPDLIILRVLSNVVYFIGRAYAGIFKFYLNTFVFIDNLHVASYVEVLIIFYRWGYSGDPDIQVRDVLHAYQVDTWAPRGDREYTYRKDQERLR